MSSNSKSSFEFVMKLARQYLSDDGVKVVHGLVNPATGTKRDEYRTAPIYQHAWVEKDGSVYDWQTLELRMGKYAGKVWPQIEFYQVFVPSFVKKYTPELALQKMWDTGTKGPWE